MCVCACIYIYIKLYIYLDGDRNVEVLVCAYVHSLLFLTEQFFFFLVIFKGDASFSEVVDSFSSSMHQRYLIC